MIIRRLHYDTAHIVKTKTMKIMVEDINLRIIDTRMRKCIRLYEEITEQAAEQYLRIFTSCTSRDIAKIKNDENQHISCLPDDNIGSKVNIDITFCSNL